MRKIVIGFAIVTFVICMTLSLGACNVGLTRKAQNATDEEKFTFIELSDGTYSVKATEVSSLSGHLTLPSYYNGVEVTAVAYEGFSGADITKISIPSTYTQIKGYAFSNCKKLQSIEFSDSVISIGQGAFEGCSALVNTIRLPLNLQSLGSRCFALCPNLLVVDIPKTLSFIGENVFEGSTLVTINVDSDNPYYKVENNVIVAK